MFSQSKRTDAAAIWLALCLALALAEAAYPATYPADRSALLRKGSRNVAQPGEPHICQLFDVYKFNSICHRISRHLPKLRSEDYGQACSPESMRRKPREGVRNCVLINGYLAGCCAKRATAIQPAYPSSQRAADKCLDFKLHNCCTNEDEFCIALKFTFNVAACCRAVMGR